MTIASMSAARLTSEVKSGRTRSIPIISGRREAQAHVDDDDPPVALEHGHVLADLTERRAAAR